MFDKHSNTFIKSIRTEQQNRSLSKVKSDLVENNRKIFCDEEIIFHKKELGHTQKTSTGWAIATKKTSDYPRLWVHRWLALYVLNTLSSDTSHSDKQDLVDFVRLMSHTALFFLRDYKKLIFRDVRIVTIIFLLT